MPPNDAGAREVETRTFSYSAGPVGPAAMRAVPVEAPVEIVLAGAPFAVMMATPADLEDFAFGFLLTEGVVERPDEIRAVEVGEGEGGLSLRVALAGDRLKTHLARRRAIAGRTGCGLCGVEDLASLRRPGRPSSAAAPIRPSAVAAALGELATRQPLNDLTRAVHAAAWCSADGGIVLSREDVGRHNALDKAIGALWRAGVPPEDGFFVITSRCSFEMVAKAAIFGARALVSVSAPTSLALDAAKEAGITLVAVARADHALAFTNGEAGGLAA